MSSVITNRTVKPFIEAHDFSPGYKLEEECFEKAVIKDVDAKITRKKDQEPMLYPRLKPTAQIVYENFLEEVINPKTGEFYPERNESGAAIKGTGATYYITDVYRIRRADGSEYLYTKGRVYAFNSLGDPVNHSISMPEKWTRTNFTFKTQFDPRTNQLEKVFQGVSGNTLEYTMPFTKEALKSLYDRRQNDLINFLVIQEGTDEPRRVEETNAQKRFELTRDQSFEYLLNSQYMSPTLKAQYRQEAIDRGLLPSGSNTANSQPSSSATTPKNTYQ